MRNLLAIMVAFLFGSAAIAQVPAPPVVTPAATPENILYLDLSTGGKVAIQLRPDMAPGHVARVKMLVRRGFYDGLVFHRVIEGFMAQGGDPKGSGEGGSELPDLKAEFNVLPHLRGSVSMARAENPDTANSQFFIMFAPRMSLDGRYTVFGRVIGGMQFVDAITRGEGDNGKVEANATRIVKASIAGDVPGAVPASPPAPGGQLVSAPAAPAKATLPVVAAKPAPVPAKKVRKKRH